MINKIISGIAAFVTLSLPLVSQAETIYTANEGGSSISRITWPGDGKSAVIPISAMPHNVDIAAKKKLVLVTGMGGVLLVLDSKGELVKKIKIGTHPAHVISDPSGGTAYVVLSGENSVAVVDLEKGETEKKIPVGDHPHGLRMSPDGKEIYVANMGDNTISVISVQEKKEIARIPVGKKPVQVAVSPDGRVVYVSLNDENAIAVVDVVHRNVLKKVATGDKPVQLMVASGKLFVANQGSRDAPGNIVTVIDTSNNEAVASIPVGSGPHGVASSLDGKVIFITNVYSDEVSAIDVEKMSVVKTVPVGKEPNGIAVSGW